MSTSTSTSTGSPPAATGHPIVEFTDRLRRRLGELAETAAWSMSPAEQRAVLVDLHRAGAQLEELRLRVLVAGDRADIAADSAATSTGSWLANATTQPRGKAHAEVTLALALDTDFTATRDALAAGLVDADQARVIVHAVDRVRSDAVEAVAADPSIPERAEKHLIALAGEYDARALKALGRHVFEVLDPDAADTALGQKLQAQEQAAARKTYLELFDNGDGTHSGRFKIPALNAAMFVRTLEAFTSPSHRRPSKHTGVESATRLRRPRPELLGQAFSELLERLDPARLPASGGSTATVVVTLDYDTLLSGLGTARLDTGEQGGCTAEACGRPAAWCHAHHDSSWARGGRTDLANGRLLCPYHHGKAHTTGYATSVLPGGKLRFHRRT
jgi:hypothetical protein